MFKATEVKRKNKRNKYAYWYTNKSIFVQNFRPLLLAASPVIVMRLVMNKKCIYACAKVSKSC